MMVSFTASRDDFKLYLTCPRKLSLKTMGVRVREVRSVPRLAPAQAIGMSGEKLTEEILEIIASIQADESKGEHVETFRERSEPVKEGMEALIEKLKSKASPATPLSAILPETDEEINRIVRPTITEAFHRSVVSELLSLQEYKERLEREMREGFIGILGGMLESLPKMISVYKPTLRNRDTCSLGIPDYQVETIEGHVLIEVKNLDDLGRAVNEGRDNLLYYNSLIGDLELGDSRWWSSKLPRPLKSLVVVPRWGALSEVDEPIPNFRNIAVEIWKIKRAALVEGVLPDTKPEPTVCRRCLFKRSCEKKRTEELELSKPLPLIYAVAEHEAKPEKIKLEEPKGFWEAYFNLRGKAETGNEEARMALNRMEDYLKMLWAKKEEERVKLVYRTMPEEFENWGGQEFLKTNWMKIDNASHRLFNECEENIEVILRVARKRWKI